MVPVPPSLREPLPPPLGLFQSPPGDPDTHAVDLLSIEEDVSIHEGPVSLFHLDGNEVSIRC